MRSIVIFLLTTPLLLTAPLPSAAVAAAADSAAADSAAADSADIGPAESGPAAGSVIVFQANRSGTSNLYRVAPDGRGLEPLTDSPSNQLNVNPHLSADGRRVFFLSNPEGGSWGTYALTLASGEVDKLADFPARPSRDGELLAVVERQMDLPDLYVVPVGGGEKVRLTHFAAEGRLTALRIGDWSPDGSRIAIAAGRDADALDLYIVTLPRPGEEAAAPLRLTRHRAEDSGPVFSPDGERLAFTSHRDGVGAEIYVIDADGENLTRLTDNRIWDSHPAWSPDGGRLVFESTRNEGDYELFLMDADGGAVEQLTHLRGDDGHASWAPAPAPP